MFLKIQEIIVNERIRHDVGNLNALSDSISKVGLLNPILVNENNELISGFRRLEACKSLGWEEIDVKVVNLNSNELKALELEMEENNGRLALTDADLEKYKEKIQGLMTPPKQPNSIVAFIQKIWAAIKKLFTKSAHVEEPDKEI